ncbi:hypothetical protein ACFFMN_33740 [Planobispora siamensis]|uniref:Uncharacterized protein n=1 Tax=Planobispora siamensis TaxID=936338 RepID=A0A8J3SG66_9ACTN|nr:hypothetical protein [Planobispora siamensis]GIH91986.1 hypothetical protein Psi01_26160 [Planobispora siamensis]
MTPGIDTPPVTASARLPLRGYAEVRGIHHRPDGPPVGTVSLFGVELDLQLAGARAVRDAMDDLIAGLERAETAPTVRAPEAGQ